LLLSSDCHILPKRNYNLHDISEDNCNSTPRDKTPPVVLVVFPAALRGDFDHMAPSPPPLSSVPPEQTHQPKPQMADRLGTLQQRYRQHQATMRGTTPNIPLTVIEMSNKQSENERENEMKRQRARSNSMANSSFTNLPDQHLVSSGSSADGKLMTKCSDHNTLNPNIRYKEFWIPSQRTQSLT